MAGRHTEVLVAALKTLGFRQKKVRLPPGAGERFIVTAKTLEKLQGIEEDARVIVVEDSGKVAIRAE